MSGPMVALRAATDNDASAVAEVLMASRAAFMPYAPMAHSPPPMCASGSGMR
jgi:hypothetical protein